MRKKSVPDPDAFLFSIPPASEGKAQDNDGTAKKQRIHMRETNKRDKASKINLFLFKKSKKHARYALMRSRQHSEKHRIHARENKCRDNNHCSILTM
jgi:hypothetical protein